MMKDKSLLTLIVDDSENDALLIIRELQKGGYDPIYERVETAAAMKKALKDKPWDIILCDYKMSKIDASSAIALLKEINIDIPLIIVSGAIDDATAVECMRKGAHDYILKNNLSHLCPAIARELEYASSRNRRKQAESARIASLKALLESQERYKALFDRSLNLIYIMDFNGQFIDANNAALNLFGYNRKDIHSVNVKSLVDEDQLPLVLEMIQEVKQAGIQKHLREIRLRHKDGREIYVEGQGSIVMSKGKPVAIQVIAYDITERKKREEKLRKSEENYRQLFDNAPSMIYRIDFKNGKLIKANDILCEYIGCRQEDITSFSPYDILTEESKQLFLERLGEMARGEEVPDTVEYEIIDIKGRRLCLQLHNKNIYDAEGNIVASDVVAHDITERKSMEEKLQENEKKYRTFFNTSRDCVYITSTDGRLDDVNDAAFELFGYSNRDELMKLNISDLYVRKEERTKLINTIMEKGFSKDYPVDMRKKDGGVIHTLITATFQCDADGKTTGFMGTIKDITERKKTEMQLQQTLDSLRNAISATIKVLVSALEARDPYTAGHQLRVADLARAIAMEMGLDQEKMDGIRMAGSIHDIGKLSIPAEILSKPTKLTDLEFSLIKEHSQSGYEMLKDVASPWPLAQIVYQHHERLNGTGYPQKLKGNEILIEARIMGVADVVEAMASHRPYRAGLGIDVALEEIEKNKGVLYDAAVADACLRLFREKGYQFT